MSLVRKYLAEIGRRGGIRSRRVLDPETARRMVDIREARRVARRSQAVSLRGGTPADTSIAAQTIQDALLRRFSSAEQLAHVARLSRMVDRLSLEGLRQRHPAADDEMIRFFRAELRLGRRVAARVYGRTMTAPDEQDPVAIALDVGALLDSLGIAWVIGGSIASSVHGEPRATQDVDIVADLRLRHVKPFVSALARDYYVDADVVRVAVKTAGLFNAVHYASAIKADFFVAGDDAFEAERLANRLPVAIAAGVLYVDTAEQTILRKLEWYRRGAEESERQWRDVQAIVRIQGDRLDYERLRLWASRLGVADLLQRVIDETAA